MKFTCEMPYRNADNAGYRFRLNRIAVVVTALVFSAGSSISFAGDYFSVNSLSMTEGQNIADLQSLDQFAAPGGQLPGDYHVDIIVNGVVTDARTITFTENNDNNGLTPVLTKADLVLWGINTEALPELAALPPEQEITAVSRYIPDASVTPEINHQRLLISVPQIAMNNTVAGGIPEAQWENGVTAFILNYYYSGSNNHNNHTPDTDAHYLNLRSGLNLGAWRINNYSAYSVSAGEKKWQNIDTSLERGINFIKSRLIIGDSSTPGDIFDGFQFRGLQLQSDESMMPDAMKGFAPVIRGIAQSNAEVTVRQNGYVIYQTYVAPGAFEINDLHPTGTNGDLTLVIKEADGTERTSIVPFSSVAIMQREGQLRYSLTGGKFRAAGDGKEPDFFQGTLIYGLPKGVTAYTGTILADNYQSLAAGAGINMGNFGAFSADVTHAGTRQLRGSESRDSGRSYRVQYSKNMMTTGTSVTLANYRYSTDGYYSFEEANKNRAELYRDSKKNRIQVTISQSLDEYGSVYLSAYQQDYRNRAGKERSAGAGYNNSYEGISYNLSYSYSDNAYQHKADNQLSFSVSIPLTTAAGSNASFNTSVTTDNSGRSDMMAGISGNLSGDNRFSYSVQQSYANKGTGAGGNASASYRGSYGVANAGYSYDKNSQRLNYGLTGAVIAHPYGVTLSQPVYDAFAIVRAPGAENVAVTNRSGVSTDRRGYAIVPYLNAYTKNEVALDVSSLPANVELKSNTVSVVPTKGAAVVINYQTHVGYRILFTVTKDGSPVPFGAVASSEQNGGNDNSTGIADENGDVYLSGMPEKGRINIQWGNSPDKQCRAAYQLTQSQTEQHLPVVPVTCH